MEALVREVIDAATRSDFAALEDVAIHPELEFASLFAIAEGETWRGVEGVRRWRAEVDAIWEDFQVEVESVEQVGEDTAVLCARLTGRAKGSGVPLDRQLGQVWTREDGLLRRVVAYPTYAEARAAAVSGSSP